MQYVGTSEDENIFKKSYLLRSFYPIGAPQDRHYQLYISIHLREWAFFDHAYNDGTEVKLLKIDTQVGDCHTYGCDLTEDMAIPLSEEQMQSYAVSGFNVKLYGKRDSIIISVPASVFSSYLGNAIE